MRITKTGGFGVRAILAGMRWPSRRMLLAVGCAAVIAVLAGTVPALAGGKTVTYYACAGKSGPIDIASQSARCPGSEHKISWNNTGPQGPPGAATGYEGYLQPHLQLTTTSQTVGGLSLPTGTFEVNASMTVTSQAASTPRGDVVECQLVDGAGTTLDEEQTALGIVDAYVGVGFIGLTGITSHGGATRVTCADDFSNSKVFAISMTAIRLGSADITGSVELEPRRPMPKFLALNPRKTAHARV